VDKLCQNCTHHIVETEYNAEEKRYIILDKVACRVDKEIYKETRLDGTCDRFQWPKFNVMAFIRKIMGTGVVKEIEKTSEEKTQ
jgi:hypothetical protein